MQSRISEGLNIWFHVMCIELTGHRRLCSWECLFIFKQTVAFLTRGLASLVLASGHLKDRIHSCLILIWFWLDDWISRRETASCSLCVPTALDSGWVCTLTNISSFSTGHGKVPVLEQADGHDLSTNGLQVTMTCLSLACRWPWPVRHWPTFLQASSFLCSASTSDSGAWFCQSWQTCVFKATLFRFVQTERTRETYFSFLIACLQE